LPELIESPPFWLYIAGFLLLLGPLVTVHEFGHYLMGRLFGVGVEAFSVGFGKEIAGFTDRRGTRWKLSALPLGGYCQFKGDMNPASIPDADAIASMSPAERDGSFHHAALWKRALIVFAGPLTNIIVALGIFTAFNLAYGKPIPPDPARANIVGSLLPGSAAEKAGIVPGDKVIAIGQTPVADVMEVAEQVMLYPGRSSSVTVLRDGREITMPVTFGAAVERDQFGNASTVGRIGVRWKYVERPHFEPVGAGDAVAMSFRQSATVVDMMVTGIAQIVSGQRSVKELGGPLKIAKFSGEQLSLGAQAFIWFAALISLNLAFINLLPIPALDGGHLAFYAAEAVRRKPIGARGQEMAFRAGVAMILALMLFVTMNDLLSLPIFGR
jgi:regulator of sigma E protease